MKNKKILQALVTLILISVLGVFLHIKGKKQENYGFSLGLDLSGGVELLYKADISNLSPTDIKDSLSVLRDTIERRVNAFGVGEPLVQIEEGSNFSDAKYRLRVELPGLKDIQKAIDAIGKTPVLEFRMKKESAGTTTEEFGPAIITGAHLKKAYLQLGNGSDYGVQEPVVVLNFNDEGKEIFAKTTKENVGKVFGIFLDGKLLSAPVIREPILGGSAVISGSFTVKEAQDLVRNLNFGALPVPIKLLSSQQIGAALGKDAAQKGLVAFAIGVALVSSFMIIWYRLPGVVSVISLFSYIVIMFAIFKYLPVVLTAAGIAGFILSIGMAVDANVLIFERMKEELRHGKKLKDAINIGFERAWTSIRDANISSLIIAIILFWFGTSLLKGFALVFAIGIIVSVLSAVYISRILLLALSEILPEGKRARELFKSGLK